FSSHPAPLGSYSHRSLTKRRSQLAEEATIYKLIQHNKENFIETASNIIDGHTEVAPLKYKQKLPCDFCSYQSVCHVDGMI
ncbi:hypothetical protein Q0P26_14145, partial [Staphylococcus aureus]|nr:hypothetical protein [Staphylococcus aureus]